MRYLVWVLIALLFTACSANRSDQSEMDRALKAMDTQNYWEAKAILQLQLMRHPGDHHLMLLLAEADLGLSGIQLLDLLGGISQPQSVGELDLLAPPDCDSEKVSRIHGTDIRCILLRVAERLPSADDPNFAEARELLRQSDPDPSLAPASENFLSAVVELGSAMSRVRSMLEQSQLDPGAFHFVVHNLKGEMTELTSGLRRLRYSYPKLSQYVVSLDGKPLIRIGDQELDFRDDINWPTLLGFAESTIDEYKDVTNQRFDQALRSGFNTLPSATIMLMEHLDQTYSLGFFTDGILIPALSFDRRLDHFLSLFSSAGTPRKESFNLLQLLWKHPPAIIRPFPKAFSLAWDEEQIDPLNEYYDHSRAQWLALQQLESDWDQWTNQMLSPQDLQRIADVLRRDSQVDPRLCLPPENPSDEALAEWQQNMIAAMEEHSGEILSSKQDSRGLSLLKRTSEWIQMNLWTIH